MLQVKFLVVDLGLRKITFKFSGNFQPLKRLFPLFNADESILYIFKFEKNRGCEFQYLSILLDRKVPLKITLQNKHLFVIITDVYVELQFLDKNLEYFIPHPFGKF